MFFRKITTKKNGKEYIYVKLIENYRMDGKVKQRVIANFGSVENLSSDRINYLIASLKKLQNEIKITDKEGAIPAELTLQLNEIRSLLSCTNFKQAIPQAVGQQAYEILEALLIKSLVAEEVNKPAHEVCKNLGLVEASSLQFYNGVRKLGQEEVKVALNKNTFLSGNGNENNHKHLFVHIVQSQFDGTSYEVDVTGNMYFAQNYHKPLILLLACDEKGMPVDFEYAEEVKEIHDYLDVLVNRLKDQLIGQVVVLDGENTIKKDTTNYLVAHLAQELPKEIFTLLNQGCVSQDNKLFFDAVRYEQKSEVKIKEIKANLAKVAAGLENIKADILLGKLSKESAVRKKADSVIKANGCEEMVSFNYNEATHAFYYKIDEAVVKQKKQSKIQKTWVISGKNVKDKNLQSITTVNIKTDQFKLITDQLKIPPINMYVDYHYSPEVISGHIQLEIIKHRINMAMNTPELGGDI